MKKLLLIKVLVGVSIIFVSACSDNSSTTSDPDNTKVETTNSDTINTTKTDEIDSNSTSNETNTNTANQTEITSDATNTDIKTPVSNGEASWYGGKFHGRLTASGEKFDMNAMTAAHRTLTFGTKVKVINQKNGKSTIVCINDRGPYSKNRVLDLSKGAATEVDMISTGTANVTLQVLNEPSSSKYGEKVCLD